MFKFLQDLANKIRVRAKQEEKDLLAGDLSNYVERKADEELLHFIKTAEVPVRLCYILAPPQTGKTWLMKKTASRLAQEGDRCFQFSLKLSATTFSESAFYLHLLTKICQELSREGMNLVEILDQFWHETESQKPGERFQKFVREIFNKLVSCQVVIFIDNVQKLRAWNSHQSFGETIKTLFESGDKSLQKLTFVLLGTDNSGDFFPNHSRAIATEIKLENFQADCQPLLDVLQNVSSNPKAVLAAVLSQTGGQPFLTQSLSYLVEKEGNISQNTNLRVYIKELAKNTLIADRRNRAKSKSHFQSIENYFIGDHLDDLDRKLSALNLYGRIADGQSYEFKANSSAHRDLLMSGLAIELDNCLKVANPIYEQFFTQEWVEAIQKKLKERRGDMPSKKIYDRKVYMMIDQSGSMARRDALFNNERRWKAIAEVLEGHVYTILDHEGMDGEKICDEITMTFFSPNRPSAVIRSIQDDSQVIELFEENRPDSNTFITPTFQQVVEQWFATREQNQGGFVIIYTDGALDDRNAFVNYVEATCSKLNSQDDLKVVIVGFGSELDRDPKFYLKLDGNARGFSDKNARTCNIVVFDLLHKMPGILQLLDSQLENPDAGLPDWGREHCPELYG